MSERKLIKKNISDVPWKKVYEHFIKEFEKKGLTDKLDHDLHFNQFMRIQTLWSIKSYFHIGNNPHIIVFKLNDLERRVEINYGFLFAYDIRRMEKDIYDMIFYVKKKYIYGNYSFMHFSFGPSMVSCDGEYRPRLIRWHDLDNVRGAFIEIWNDINEYIASGMDDRQWTCYTNHFATHVTDVELDSIIKTELFPVMFLSAAWFITVYNEIYMLGETHMNENFKSIILKDFANDKKFFNNLVKKYTEEHVEKFKIHLTTMIHSIPEYDKPRIINMGFKMVPLNLLELEEAFNLHYKPWRELYIGYAANNLVMNFITPGLPILSNWHFVKNIRKGLFDNTSQYDRMKNSELARDIIRQLYNAQRGTYVALNMTNGKKEKMLQYINSKFKRLNDKIEGPIEYAIEEIIMSDGALVTISENIGRTVADTFTIIENNKILDTALGKPLTDGGYDLFAKYIFEICYTLLCINKRLGIIHGDLHLNNATIGLLYYKPMSEQYIKYSIDDQNYYFRQNGYIGGVIDFSRALLLTDMISELDHPCMPIITQDETLVTHEIDNILDIYIKLFPNKIKIKDKLKYIFEFQYEAAFKLITAIDIFMFVTRLSILLQKNNSPSKRALHLLDQLHKISETFITSHMNQLIEHPETYAKEINDGLWPNQQIIQKCFPDFMKKREPLSHTYNLDNKIEFNINTYEGYPESLTSIRWGDKKDERDVQLSDVRLKPAMARDKLIIDQYENVMKISHDYKKKINLEQYKQQTASEIE